MGTGIVNAAEVKVEDDRYVYMTTAPGSSTWASEFYNYRVSNSVKLKYNESAKTYYTNGWTVTVPLRLDKWDATGAGMSNETFTLTITYDPAAGVTYNDLSQYTAVTPGHRTKLTVTGAVTSTAPGGTVPTDVMLESVVEVERYYYFDYDATPDIAHEYNSSNNTLTFYWEYLQGAEEYDLEWTFVSAYDDNTTPDYTRTRRVTLNAQRYTINLPFDDGQIYYRVRGAGVHEDDWHSRLDGAWGTCVSAYTVGNLDATKNWSYSAVYAEDGKRKEVVTFFDGSLRQRQAVAINNSENVAIQTETFYDYEGRAVIQTLPSPDASFGSELKFYTVQSANASTGYQYKRRDYDKDALFGDCTMGNPSAMSENNGASRYYSPSNARVSTTYYAAIPDANQFPFTQVAYDREGRVKKQSGAGEDFTIGEDQAVEYYYANPSQERLDRLFGVEAGDAEHYSLRAAKDANGQVSLAYVDMHGRVVATSLAGEAPDNLDVIEGNSLETYTQDFTAQNYYDPTQEAWIINSSILVTNPGTDYDFTYVLTPQQYESLCNDEINGDCEYELEIRIYDACNVPINSTGDISLPYAHTEIGPGGITYDFTVQFPKVGTYRIEKKLTLSEDALDAAVEAFIAALDESDCVASQSSYQLGLLGQYTFDCNDCQTWCEQQADAQELVGEERDEFIEDCIAENCNNTIQNEETNCSVMYDVLKADMSQGGQYYEASGWMYDNLESTPAPYGAAFDWSNFNTWVNTNCGYNPGLSNWAQVESTWDDCYGGYLVQFHPEYCQYEWCLSMDSSNVYDMMMFGDGTSDAANEINWAETTLIPWYAPVNTDPYIDQTPSSGSVGQYILDHDPFFKPWAAGYAYLSGTDQMQEELDDYQNTSTTMWDYAGTAAGCTGCDDQWQAFRAIYLATKQGFVKEARQVDACYPIYDNTTPPDGIADGPECNYTTINPPNCNPPGVNGFIIRWPDYTDNLGSITTTTEAGDYIEAMAEVYEPCRTPATLTVTIAEGEYALEDNKCITLSIDDGTTVTDLMAAPICQEGTYTAEDLVAMIVLAINSYVSAPVDYTAEINPLDPLSYIIYAPASLGATPNNVYVQMDDFPPVLVSDVSYSNSGEMDNGADDGPCPQNAHCLCAKIMQMQQMWDATYVDPTDELTYNYINHATYSGNFNAYVLDMLNNIDGTIDQSQVDNWILNCTESEGQSPETDVSEDETDSDEPITSVLDCEHPETDCDEDAPELTAFWGTYLYQQAVQSAVEDFILQYKAQCWNYGDVIDSLRLEYQEREYHYTLYYYDQAGNLTRTVPPAAVEPLDLSATYMSGPNTIGDEINDYRNGILGADFVVPKHSPLTTFTGATYVLATYYKYNSLNQVEQSTSPDAGTTYFFYDKIGRIIASQNANQNSMSGGGTYFYSYIRYDAQGRVTESGQVQKSVALTHGTPMDYASYETWLAASSVKTEVTEMYYDTPLNGAIAGLFLGGQKYLRKRVATATYERVYDTDPDTYDHATHYSYDVHGNVDTLIQETPELADLDQQYKYIAYSYDLVSGNVNEVHYQSGEADQSHHRYYYDADNRLTNVYTTTNNVTTGANGLQRESAIDNWDQDAKYIYYLHGPLARTEIGDNKVQGLDYAYTINGWSKGVNANTLSETNDLGKDGSTQASTSYQSTRAGIHSNVGRDAFGYVLGYYWDTKKDWEPISSAAQSLYGDADDISDAGQDLFNGNIKEMSTALMKPNNSSGPDKMALICNHYQYDQLNRITDAVSFTGASTSSYNALSDANDEYRNTFSYDPNGNIQHQLRNGQTTPGVSMDDLAYHYYANTNQLEYVGDGGTSGNYADDLENQSAANYTYTPNGELSSDVSEGITQINWMINGKIHSIDRDPTTSKADLEFKYDAMGNRICKIEKPTDGSDRETEHTWNYTYYVRDASGNVIAVYTRDKNESDEEYNDVFQLSETHIYGSQRLGIKNREAENITATTVYEFNGYDNSTPGTDGYNAFEEGDVVSNGTFATPSATDQVRTKALKLYELSNHLGNVLVTFLDKKIAKDDIASGGAADYYVADVVSASDYSAFGAPLPGRTYYSDEYRYGYVGMEHGEETHSQAYSADFREYDSRLGRFSSVDPYAGLIASHSPYTNSYNCPIVYTDRTGLYPDPKNIKVANGAINVDQARKLITMDVSITLDVAVKLVNASKGEFPAGYRLETMASDIQGKINSTYSGKGSYTTLNIPWWMDFKHSKGEDNTGWKVTYNFSLGTRSKVTAVTSEEQLMPGDHIITLVDDAIDDDGGVTGRAELEGNFAITEFLVGSNETDKKNKYNDAVAVSTHEFGHLLGLEDEYVKENGVVTNTGGQNVMGSARGYSITSDQLGQIGFHALIAVYRPQLAETRDQSTIRKEYLESYYNFVGGWSNIYSDDLKNKLKKK
jgi:RHS repeat-associated protein